VKTNPFGGLFNPSSADAQKTAFDTHLVTQVPTLAATTLAGIDLKIPDVFNGGQSLSSGAAENNYLTQFAGPSTLRTNVTAAIPAGSTLTADDIVSRARALSCAGCHRLNSNVDIGGGLTWPASQGFTHISEQSPVVGADGVLRFQLSAALTDAFLPVRKQVLEDFLNDKPPNAQGDDPIGGRRVH
jgi:hypothetical protein